MVDLIVRDSVPFGPFDLRTGTPLPSNLCRVILERENLNSLLIGRNCNFICSIRTVLSEEPSFFGLRLD